MCAQQHVTPRHNGMLDDLSNLTRPHTHRASFPSEDHFVHTRFRAFLCHHVAAPEEAASGESCGQAAETTNQHSTQTQKEHTTTD